jgi:peptide/nickel transport system permease protein
MSVGILPTLPLPEDPDPAYAIQPRNRSYWAQVFHDTLRQNTARIGLIWITFLVLVAVFAPLLANTMPLLVKIDGHWSSPFLQHITPADVTLLVLTASIVVMWLAGGLKTGKQWLILSAILLVTIILTQIFITPPKTIDWLRYRTLAGEGKIQAEMMTPIPYSANDYQRDDLFAPLQPPSRKHLLGTEVNGGDILSRMIHASRIALSIGLVSTGISVVIGIFIGGLMGYFAGRTDLIGMRLIEIFEAIPTLFLIITFVAFFGRDLIMIMAIIGFTGWTDEARFIRAEFLRLRKQDFVQAARASGLPLHSILFRHLLPNGISPILVTSSFGIASAILFESILSFLGLGPVDQPSWGQMLNQSLGVGGSFVWWIAVFPGLAIFLTVFAYNLLGESLRDALDPRLRK